MFSVQNSAQLAQCCLKVEFLECAVGGSFHWVSTVYFSLETHREHKYVRAIMCVIICHLQQLGLEAAHGGHSHDLAALRDDRQLVEALLDHDVDGLLHGHTGQDGQWRGQLQGAHLLIRPPGVQILIWTMIW